MSEATCGIGVSRKTRMSLSLARVTLDYTRRVNNAALNQRQPAANARLLQYPEVSPGRQPVTRPASLHSS